MVEKNEIPEDVQIKGKTKKILAGHGKKYKYDVNESRHPNAGLVSRKKYIPIELLIAYFEKELTFVDIGHILGMTPQVVRRRLNKAGYYIKRDKCFKKHEAHVIENIKRRIAESISEKDINKASLLQKLTSFGVLFDKGRLLEGKSTENIEEHHRIEELNQTKQELLKLVKGIEEAEDALKSKPIEGKEKDGS
tara:strand:+ start:13463 stop:14041 length:579 start_codon:yes stop_codon:yes gene_type:complete